MGGLSSFEAHLPIRMLKKSSTGSNWVAGVPFMIRGFKRCAWTDTGSKMRKLAFGLAAAIALSGVAPAFAQTSAPATLMTTAPAGKTINKYYKQNVYDPDKAKIGSIDDMSVSDSGQVEAFIIGVGGFLGMGEKNVAVAYSSVRAEMKDNAWYLTLNTTKDALKAAPGVTYDKTKSAYVPAGK